MAEPGGVFAARHVGMLLQPSLARLADHPLVYRPWGPPPRQTRAVIGWGLKGKFRDAARWAARHGLPYVAVEDGLLRSVGLGDADPPLSLLFDDVGVYYDARSASRMERCIAAPHDAAQHARAAALVQAWRRGGISKYNHAPEFAAPLPPAFVLAVDQTFGDMSIELGLASPASFGRMLEAALDEHPGLPVLLKVHPDVVAGRKRGHFERLSAGAAARITLLADDAHPSALLAAAQAVHVVSSQMGFEALMHDKPVRCFGMPFYAGWGVTADELPPPERRRTPQPVRLPDLVHAALVEMPRYLDPETFERCEAERLVDWMALQRRQRIRHPPRVQAVAFSDWKQPIARAYFGASTLRFVDSARPDPAVGARAVWGRPDDAAALQADGLPLLRVEDGFLRSVGLGADWVWPLSWVIDRSGMYYDAGAPSDLETLLQRHEFDDALRARAAALRAQLVAAGITKYNVGRGPWHRPADARRVVLVPGQVESDKSIRYGAPGLRTNLDLLRAVRAARPDAHLVYKPHPDVLARKREPGADIDAADRWCDEVVTDVPMGALLDRVDEVQVLTSLAGFEALLRGKVVVCHGSPFFAGWGLTEDHQAHPRRQRRLTLDELVAGALILYPSYVSRVSRAFCTPERALHELAHWHDLPALPDPWLLRSLRRLKRWRERRRRP